MNRKLMLPGLLYLLQLYTILGMSLPRPPMHGFTVRCVAWQRWVAGNLLHVSCHDYLRSYEFALQPKLMFL